MFSLRRLSLGLAAAAIAFCSASSANAAYMKNEIIVKYKSNFERTSKSMQEFYNSAEVVRVERYHSRFKDFERLYLSPNSDMMNVMGRLRANPAVAYVQPNYILHAFPYKKEKARDVSSVSFNLIDQISEVGAKLFDGDRPALAPKPADVNPPVADPDVSYTYGMKKIGADKVWGTRRGSQNIIVAVIDTGIDYNHPDLAFNVWRNPQPDPQFNDIVGWDFIHNDGLPFDDNEHGTHCSGVIGAVGGNGIGISGVNQRVSIMGVKFLSGEGSGTTADAVKSVDYAVRKGAKVLSNSWGGGDDPDNKFLEEAIQRAEQAGVLFVAAAGNETNDNDANPTYPAAFTVPNMLTVAATDSTDGRAYFSNWGAKTVHLGAPGVNVYSTTPNNTYAKLSGTSMACPHVAGAAALVWSMNPNATYKDIKMALLKGVDPVASLKGKTLTSGRLNVAKSMSIMYNQIHGL